MTANSAYSKHSKTAKTSLPMWGDRLYQRRARLALPVLVHWASKRKRMFYSELANELDMLHHRPTNKVLGSVGATLIELSDKINIDIPPIQVLVINKNTKLPGSGVGWFIEEEEYYELSKHEKQSVVKDWQQKIFEFDKWEYVLEQLGLAPYHSSAFSRERLTIPIKKEGCGRKKEFHKWLTRNKSEKTASNYSGAIGGFLSSLASNEGWIDKTIFKLKSVRDLSGVSLKLHALHEFIEANNRGNGMYAAALNAYEEFFSETIESDVEVDVGDLITDASLDHTMKATLVNTRLGQGKFRQKLLSYWRGCSVTGYKRSQMLLASHIKPWRSSNDHERLSMFNGLLLIPSLDKAFDCGLITFKDSGQIQISRQLERPKLLGIDKSMSIRFEKQHFEYLSHHRKVEFRD